jgi:hypothetical protein
LDAPWSLCYSILFRRLAQLAGADLPESLVLPAPAAQTQASKAKDQSFREGIILVDDSPAKRYHPFIIRI